MGKANRHGIITALWIVLLAIGSFAYAMTKPLDHNEHMYISAARLLQDNTLYSDFAFLQMPYLPYLYNAFYQLSDTHHYLLWGRIWSWGLTLSAGVLLFALLRRNRPGWGGTWAILPLFLLNQTILGILAESSNYALPLAASVVAFALVTHALEGPPYEGWFAAGGGFALALAIGTKLYYGICFLPFVLVMLLYPRRAGLRHRIVQYVLPMLAGGMVGLLPAALLLLHDPQAFWFNNIEFHTTNTLWRESLGRSFAITPIGKMTFFLFLVFAKPSNIIFLALVPMGALVVLELRPYGRNMLHHLAPGTLLALLLALTTTATLFVPTPMVLQHAAMPIPFVLLVLCSFSFPIVSIAGQRRHTLLLTGVLLVTSGAGVSTLLPMLPRFVQPAQWEGIALHRAARELQQIVGEGKRIATLSPLYALEANLTIYPELASGPFLYRVGDLLDEEQRQRNMGTSPGSICGLLRRTPPDAILVGFEDETYLEKPLHECAIQIGYISLPRRLRGRMRKRGTVYVPPPFVAPLSNFDLGPRCP